MHQVDVASAMRQAVRSFIPRQVAVVIWLRAVFLAMGPISPVRMAARALLDVSVPVVVAVVATWPMAVTPEADTVDFRVALAEQAASTVRVLPLVMAAMVPSVDPLSSHT
jgi:hypothetical protein